MFCRKRMGFEPTALIQSPNRGPACHARWTMASMWTEPFATSTAGAVGSSRTRPSRLRALPRWRCCRATRYTQDALAKRRLRRIFGANIGPAPGCWSELIGPKLGQKMRFQARSAKAPCMRDLCNLLIFMEILAEWTGLEPATPGVTGRYSNQLNYHSPFRLGCPRTKNAIFTAPRSSVKSQPAMLRRGRAGRPPAARRMHRCRSAATTAPRNPRATPAGRAPATPRNAHAAESRLHR